MFKKNKEPKVDNYQEKIDKIKELLTKHEKKGNKPISYKIIGASLNMTAEEVRKTVGFRFRELTKRAYKDVPQMGNAHPDFYLFGENIEEIQTNAGYQQFKKVIKGQQKLCGVIKFGGPL